MGLWVRRWSGVGEKGRQCSTVNFRLLVPSWKNKAGI